MTTATACVRRALLAWLLLACAGCGRPVEEDVRLFNRRVSLEDQLAKLETLGIALNPGIEESDLLTFHTREEFEGAPFKLLAEVMGYEVEREPWDPISNALWMCDVERIESDGDYRDVLLRLERMTQSALGLENVRDSIDFTGEEFAWVSFKLDGRETRWDLEFDDDWLDASVVVNYDRLLSDRGSEVRIYVTKEQAKYGQIAFLAALTPKAAKAFGKLTGIALVPFN